MVVKIMLLRLMCNGYENRENKFEKKRLDMGNNPKLTTKERKSKKKEKKEKKIMKEMKSKEKKKKNQTYDSDLCIGYSWCPLAVSSMEKVLTGR